MSRKSFSNKKSKIKKRTDSRSKKPFNIVEEKTIAETEHLKLVNATYLKQGESIENYLHIEDVPKWQYVRRTGDKKVATVIATSKEGDILLIKQPRVPLNKFVWSFPSGMIESTDKTVVDGALRELLEETGYGNIEEIQSVSTFVPKSAGLTDESTTVVSVVIDKAKPPEEQELGKDEDIKYRWIKPEDVLKDLNLDQNTVLAYEVYNYVTGFLSCHKGL